MKVQHKYSTAHQGLFMGMLLVGVAAVMVIGGLLTNMNRSTTELSSVSSKAVEASVAVVAQPVTANRIFQDEINAAAVPDLSSPLSDFFTWPERLSDVRPTAAIAAPVRSVMTNRIFQDEINAAATRDMGDPQSPFFSWPEHLSDVRPATTAVSSTRARPATNRMFLDELAGAHGLHGVVVLTPDAVMNQRGPQ